MLRCWRKDVRALVFAAMLIATSPARGDDCEDVGRMGVMLGQIDRQCPKHRLTDAGRRVMIDMAARAAMLGGERCATKGRSAMLRELAVFAPKLDELAASGNGEAFNRGLCDAIASYLAIVTMGTAPIVEESR